MPASAPSSSPSGTSSSSSSSVGEPAAGLLLLLQRLLQALLGERGVLEQARVRSSSEVVHRLRLHHDERLQRRATRSDRARPPAPSPRSCTGPSCDPVRRRALLALRDARFRRSRRRSASAAGSPASSAVAEVGDLTRGSCRSPLSSSAPRSRSSRSCSRSIASWRRLGQRLHRVLLVVARRARGAPGSDRSGRRDAGLERLAPLLLLLVRRGRSRGADDGLEALAALDGEPLQVLGIAHDARRAGSRAG